MSMLKGYYKINDSACVKWPGHIWSRSEIRTARLCLYCFQPMLVPR